MPGRPSRSRRGTLRRMATAPIRGLGHVVRGVLRILEDLLEAVTSP